MLEDSDYNKISDFIPTVKSIKPQIQKLFEFMSNKTEIIFVPENSARFIEATKKIKDQLLYRWLYSSSDDC